MEGGSQSPGPRELLPVATTELLGVGARGRWGWGPLRTLEAEYPLGGVKDLDDG